MVHRKTLVFFVLLVCVFRHDRPQGKRVNGEDATANNGDLLMTNRLQIFHKNSSFSFRKMNLSEE